MDTDVIVVGAGPVGALLAAELRAGGARVTLLEREGEPTGHSRAFRLQPRTLELLDQRGLLDRFLEGSKTWPRAHFAGIAPLLELDRLGNEHPYALLIPQARTEELLEKHAVGLGVDLRRGHELTGLDEGEGVVTATVRGPAGDYRISASYLVGCDGGRSAVRKLAGFGFTGTEPAVSAKLGDVELPDPGQLPQGVPGTVRTPRGLMMAISVVPGVTRVLTTEFDQPIADRDAPMTLDELRATVNRITGIDVRMDNPRWLSRFTDATRLADTYRQGRVLLAGDAAHVHFPIGAQGLNLGLADAMNLGWKLAAVATGRLPGETLDSYEAERRPVAERVLRETRAQLALMNPDPRTDPLRELFGELIAMPEVNRWLSRELSGLEQPGAAGWVGRPRTALAVTSLGEPVATAELLRGGRGALLVTPEDPDSDDAVLGRADVVRVSTVAPGLTAALLRPDGMIAWTAPGDEPLADALDRWFGGL